jgi:biopolymer transport protein ExbD
MLTSSMVIPNALNLRLPGKSNNTQTSKQTPTKITIDRNGTYQLNGSQISKSGLEKRIRELKRADKKLSVVIIPDENAGNQYVVAVMDIAYRYGVGAILTDPK